MSDALAAGIDIELLVVPDDVAGHEAARALAAATTVSVDTDVFAKLGDAVSPQPALAVARIPVRSLAQVCAGGAIIVLAGLTDPGNVGTILRSAEATGFRGAVVAGRAVDVWNPKVVRSAAGSSFRVPVASGDEAEVVEACRSAGLRVCVLDQKGSVSLDDAELTGPLALVVGSESHGVPDTFLRSADLAVAVPMVGAVESLNAAVAASVVMFERSRQLRSVTRGLGGFGPTPRRSAG